MLPDCPSVRLRTAEAALAAGERAVRSLAEQTRTYDSPAVRQERAGLLSPGPCSPGS